MLRVLGLASYPLEAAATRYRLEQYVAPLAERGVRLEVRPFIDSRLFKSLYRRDELSRNVLRLAGASLARLRDAWAARHTDVLLVQREAMIFGPPVVEWLATRLGGCPLVLDLDDATYVAYTSPTYGRLGSALKWFGKTDDLIRWAQVVTCGNRSIAEYVESRGARAVLIPTVVDTERFRPPEQVAAREADGEPPTLGWIGTHSTFPYLESIFPVLQRLARRHSFRLKVVGAGRESIRLEGVEVESLEWNLEREISDFQSFDVGLYPIVWSDWATGKSGFKSIQYMAVGVPFVATPIGASAEIGEEGVTHFAARSEDEWLDALERLVSDKALRRRMGEAGRRHALEHYTVAAQADKLADALRQAASKRSRAGDNLKP
ncbi:MAG TPA: glycosyltransferase [Pyrinomonadaceae bacterium]|jgi:glycosyltransferase involved in cell wall biosynthesis